MISRIAMLGIFYVGCLVAAYLLGFLDYLVGADQSGIVAVLTGLAFICTLLASTRRKLLVWVIDNQLAPMLGLLGTVLGFMVALEGITGDVTAAKLAGVHTALVTTAAGMIAHIWLLIVREATR